MNKSRIQFTPQTVTLLILLFVFFILAIFRISYQKKAAIDFYQNQIAKTDLLYKTFDTYPIQADAVYVYDFSEHKTIYSKKEDEKKGIASLTKLMTSLVSNKLDSENKVTILPGMVIHDDVAPFSLGQVWKKEEIEKIMLVSSSNNAAEVLAQSLEKETNKKFIDLMNQFAQKYSLSDTFFNNPTGLDEDDIITTNISTAKDVTNLGYIAYRSIPEIAKATNKKEYIVKSPSGTSYIISNTNPFVESIKNVVLSKTGYTIQSGGNLTVLYKSDFNDHLIGITVLDSTKDGRFQDVLALIERTNLYLELYKTRNITDI